MMGIKRAAILGAILWFSIAATVVSAQKSSSPTGGQAEAEQILGSVIDKVWVLTDLHWHKGEYNHIINLCRISAAADPKNVEAYGNAGWLLWSMNRDDEATAFYEEGIKANPTSYYMYDEIGYYYYLRKKDYLNAIKYLEKSAQMADVKFSSLHILAHAYEKAGNLPLAVKTWERSAKDPNDKTAKLNLERVRRRLRTQ